MRIHLLVLCCTASLASPGIGQRCADSELRVPPRGWNSYDSSPPWTQSRESITEQRAAQDADALSNRLEGFETFTLDSGWFGEDNLYGAQTVDQYGRLVPNTTQFPSSAGGRGLRPVADRVHQLGLKMGAWIMGGVPRMAVEARVPVKGTRYTAADIAVLGGPVNKDGKATGAMDCPWNPWLVHGINMSHPGAQPYIDSLADLYADEWQLDMLKIDCVFGPDWFRGEAYITALVKAIQHRGRPMLISLSPGSSTPNVTLAIAAQKMAEALHQPMMARLTGDFWDVWTELRGHFDYEAELAEYSTRLFSPDLDMLPMGWLAHTGGKPRFSLLTQAEQRSMVSLWVMARAPLIWGGDPIKSNLSTLSLLSNQDVLAVQRESCHNQVIHSTTNESVVWAAQDAANDDARFVALFNLADVPAAVSVSLSSLRLQGVGKLHVSDLWQHDQAVMSNATAITARLGPHDAVLLKVTAASKVHFGRQEVPRLAVNGSGNLITVTANVVATLPEEMNGAGCGIEYLEHEIYGGLYSQMLVGESFEEDYNNSTGISSQWRVGGDYTSANVTLRSSNASERLNGVQYLRLALSSGEEVLAENRGLGMAGMTLVAGGELEGWLWARALGRDCTVSVRMHCGREVLAEQSLLVPQKGPQWGMFNLSLTPSNQCIGNGSFVIALRTAGSTLDLDMAFLQPGEWGRFKGLPVRRDIAEFLLSTGMRGMRMGGGTINARSQVPADSAPGSGYVLANFRGPRWHRQPMMGIEYPFASAGWGWVDFLDFCDAAELTAAVSLNERDDPVAVVEYMFGDITTAHGALRRQDGRAAPYNLSRVLLELGNERAPSQHNEFCTENGDCVEAFFSFAQAAQKRADELKLGKLPFVLALHPWGNFDEQQADQKELVQRAYCAGLDVRWDQHVNGMDPNAPYHGGKPHASFAEGFEAMRKFTAQWQQESGCSGKHQGIRTVVFEENGQPGWQQGKNIHDLARALGHAQNVLAFQRVPGPSSVGSQVRFVGQADCLQAYQQNHAPDCNPATDDRHCNDWDQGTVFFDNMGHVWGQPTYYSARMLALSHQPLVLNVSTAYNASFNSSSGGPLSTPVALDAHASLSADYTQLSIRVVNPLPEAIASGVRLQGFSAAYELRNATVLTSGSLRDDNGPTSQQRVSSQVFEISSLDAVVFPPYSFIVIQLEKSPKFISS